MDRIQRTGLISLFLLLTVGAAGLLMKGNGVPKGPPPEEVVLRPGDLPAVNLVPPERRLLTLDAARFTAPPAPHPLQDAAPTNTTGNTKLSQARVLDFGSVPPPAPQELSGRIIRVREGETLGEIAARELGSSDQWQALANANGIADPRQLKLGQELRIPLLASPAVGSASNAATPSPAVSAPALAPADADGWRTHLVLEGEVLGTISQRYYGTAREWIRILRANGMEDPMELRVGAKLRIPPLR